MLVYVESSYCLSTFEIASSCRRCQDQGKLFSLFFCERPEENITSFSFLIKLNYPFFDEMCFNANILESNNFWSELKKNLSSYFSNFALKVIIMKIKLV